MSQDNTSENVYQAKNLQCLSAQISVRYDIDQDTLIVGDKEFVSGETRVAIHVSKLNRSGKQKSRFISQKVEGLYQSAKFSVIDQTKKKIRLNGIIVHYRDGNRFSCNHVDVIYFLRENGFPKIKAVIN